MTPTLKWFNIGLRALMELGIVLALGYWGYQAGNSTAMKILPTSLLYRDWTHFQGQRRGSAGLRVQICRGDGSGLGSCRT